jgi:hypothetical protein
MVFLALRFSRTPLQILSLGNFIIWQCLETFSIVKLSGGKGVAIDV